MHAMIFIQYDHEDHEFLLVSYRVYPELFNHLAMHRHKPNRRNPNTRAII